MLNKCHERNKNLNVLDLKIFALTSILLRLKVLFYESEVP